jgi:hypothetical protein
LSRPGTIFGLGFGFVLAGAFFLISQPAAALDLKGQLTQGGLVVGRTAPGASLTLNGTKVRVAADGEFLLGFGRDAPPVAELSVTYGDGRIESHRLTIKPRRYKVQRINGLARRKVTPSDADLAHIRADNALIVAVRHRDTGHEYFKSGFTWPVRGPLSGVFGSLRILNGKPKAPHNGTDIAAAKGALVTAPADGVVVLVSDDMFYTGKTVMIDHGLGLTTIYAHMSAILVDEGAVVHRGDPIGRVGMTGRATGPHLHWGATLFITHLDPALLAGPMTGTKPEKEK